MVQKKPVAAVVVDRIESIKLIFINLHILNNPWIISNYSGAHSSVRIKEVVPETIHTSPSNSA